MACEGKKQTSVLQAVVSIHYLNSSSCMQQLARRDAATSSQWQIAAATTAGISDAATSRGTRNQSPRKQR